MTLNIFCENKFKVMVALNWLNRSVSNWENGKIALRAL